MTGAVVWFTGLPAAGKTTLAGRVRDRCLAAGRCCVLLDGDELRPLLAPARYDDETREPLYRALGGLAATVARQGVVVLVPATAHRRRWRDAARAIAPRFVEVYVAAPLAACEARDPRGVYAAARAGRAPHVPGVGEPFEPPEHPDVIASGGDDATAVDRVLAQLAQVGARVGR